MLADPWSTSEGDDRWIVFNQQDAEPLRVSPGVRATGRHHGSVPGSLDRKGLLIANAAKILEGHGGEV